MTMTQIHDPTLEVSIESSCLQSGKVSDSKKFDDDGCIKRGGMILINLV
jgi:hypothetical protein